MTTKQTASRGLREMDADRYLFPTEKLELIRQGYDYRFASNYQRVEDEDFTGPTPAQDDSLLKLVFILPTISSDRSVVDQNDKTILKILNKIRKDSHVYLQVHSEFVEIYARQVAHLAAGAQALRAFIGVNSREPGCKMYTLMHRSPTILDLSIFLQPTEELGYVQFSGAWRGVAMAQCADNFGAVRTNYARAPLSSRDLMKAIEVLGQSVRPVAGQLRMGIHFGILNATSIKRGVNSYSTTANFAAFLATVAARGTLHVHHRLGGPDLTMRIREQIYATETTLEATMQKFAPTSATTLELRDVKPKYCLVLFSGNRRIELDVQYDPDPTFPNLRPTASAPRIYESAAKFSAAEIAVACPDHKFDWHLVVEGDIAAEENGSQGFKDVVALAKSIEFDKPSEGSFEFPAFTISVGLYHVAKIDNVACKVTWAFDYVQKPLVVEASVYHDWQGAAQIFRSPGGGTLNFDTTQRPGPVKSCGMSLYGREWNGMMQTIDPASGKFDQDFLELFSDNGSPDSLEGLLEEVGYLLDILSRQARQV